MSTPARRIALAALVCAVPCALLGACAGKNTSMSESMMSPRVVAAASDAQRDSLLGKMKSLEGTWEMDAGGEKAIVTFAPTAGGTAVKETMFPGTAHEMVNLYHMDGADLVMTHYCSAGNQPRMRAKAASGKEIAFTFDSATDVNTMTESCMGNMTIEWKDANTIMEKWRSWDKGMGAALSEHAVFTLVRKK